MSQFPALPLFVREYRMDTLHLTTEQHGAYLLLIMQAWSSPQCRLPDCDEKLAAWAGLSLARWGDIRPALESFFSIRGGWWTQKRLSKEWHYVHEQQKKRRERARQGGIGKSLKRKRENSATSRTQADCKQNASTPPTPTPKNPPIAPLEELGGWLRTLVSDEPVVAATDYWEIQNLLDEGMVRKDVEAGVAAALKASFRPRYWKQLVGWVRRAAQDRMAKAPKTSSGRPAAQPDPKQLDDGYRLMLRRFKDFPGTWPPKAGPRPGEPGCMIPAHILAEFNFHAARAA